MYDILATLTKYDPIDFNNFCLDFGYNTDSIKALKTYKAVVKEYKAVVRLFGDGDILDELREIEQVLVNLKLGNYGKYGKKN